MTQSFWTRLELKARQLVPFLTTLFMVLATAAPSRLPGFSAIAPSLPMVGIFYWTIYRPDLMPAWAALLIGTLMDVIAGTPLGINALILLLIRGIVAAQRRFFLANSFPMAWASFALIAAGAMGGAWLLFALLEGQSSDPQILMWQYVVMMGIFPLMTVILAYTQMILLRDV